MNIKKIFIILVVTIVALSIVISFVISPSRNATLIVAPSPNTSFAKPPTSKIKVNSSAGEVVLPNFYDNAVAEKDGSAVIEETKDYQISFVISENRFYINLFNPNLSVTIPVAEQAFLDKLQLDKTGACKLDVKVRTSPLFMPGPPSEPTSLSFCTN